MLITLCKGWLPGNNLNLSVACTCVLFWHSCYSVQSSVSRASLQFFQHCCLSLWKYCEADSFPRLKAGISDSHLIAQSYTHKESFYQSKLVIVQLTAKSNQLCYELSRFVFDCFSNGVRHSMALLTVALLSYICSTLCLWKDLRVWFSFIVTELFMLILHFWPYNWLSFIIVCSFCRIDLFTHNFKSSTSQKVSTF